MKLLSFILLAVIMLSLEMASAKSERLIIWIHGIGSSQRDTGFMKMALENHLPLADDSQKYQFEFFDYDTVNPKKIIPDFVKDLGEFLTTKENEASKNTKVSLIAHSQGGLIVYEWLAQNCAVKKRKHPICSRIDSLTTLGSPLWGSRMASLAYDLKDKFGDILHLAEFGKAQLKDLSIYSDAVFSRLNLFTAPEHQNFRDLFKNQIKLKVIIGYSPVYSPILDPFFPGLGAIEDDFSVSVASADPQALTSINGQLGAVDMPPISYYKVKSMHMPSLKSIMAVYLKSEYLGSLLGSFDLPSLTDVDASCVDKNIELCKTPVLKPLINSILNRPDEDVKDVDFRSFAVVGKIDIEAGALTAIEEYVDEVQVQSPEDIIANAPVVAGRDYLTVSLVGDNQQELTMGGKRELYANVKRFTGNKLRFHFSGNFNSSNLTQGAIVNINWQGRTIKRFRVNISGGKTSFVLGHLNDEDLIHLIK